MTKPVRKSGFLVLAVVMVVLGSVACGGEKATPTATKSVPSTPTATQPLAAVPARNLAYIANVMPPAVSILDADKLTLVDTIVFRDLATPDGKGKQQGHFLSVSPDGKYLWIGEDISDKGGYVQVVDLATRAILQKWDVGAGVGNYLTRDGKYLFTSSTKTNNINVFDIVNKKYLGDFPIGAAPHVLDSSPDGKTLWTTDAKGGNLRSFDISGLPDKLPTPLDTIKIGGTLHAVLIHPNGKYVFVGSDESGDNVVDIATKTIVAKVPGKPHNYEISPDRKYLLSGETDYATCDEMKVLGPALGDSKGPLLRFVNIAALNTAGTPDLSTIKTEKWLDTTGLGPASISHQKYDATGKYLLVTTYRYKDASPNSEGELLIVNADTLKVERVLTLPARPHGIAVPGLVR